jgi:hypothetical protein
VHDRIFIIKRKENSFSKVEKFFFQNCPTQGMSARIFQSMMTLENV